MGDVSSRETLKHFATEVASRSGRVDFLVNNALPRMKGLDDCSYEDFQYALAVGVTAPFYLTKLLAPHFAAGASVINIAFSRDRMSQSQTESYTAALAYALAISLVGKARVNSVSPGWIDTTSADIGGADALQQPAGRVGKPEATARALADAVVRQGMPDFQIHAITGTKDIAYPNLDPQMKAMEARPEAFGGRTRYDVMEGGVHDYETIFRYLYNALPEIGARESTIE